MQLQLTVEQFGCICAAYLDVKTRVSGKNVKWNLKSRHIY